MLSVMVQLCTEKQAVQLKTENRFSAIFSQPRYKQACKCSFLSINTFLLFCQVSAVYYSLIKPWLCFFHAFAFKAALINTDKHKGDEKCWVQACLLHKYEWKHFSQIPPLDYRLTVVIITIIRFSINIPGRLLQPSGIDRPKLEISKIQMTETGSWKLPGY